MAEPPVPGLDGATGVVEAEATPGPWRLSEGGRNAVDSTGKLVFPVVDTAWALPFRATEEEAEVYAAGRAEQGFNAALLMAIQPDGGAEGPSDRVQPLGFGRAFRDLPEGHLNDLNPEYFRYLDRLVGILRRHGIAPIWSPLFFGFGWRGLRVIGPVADSLGAARFARYLAARYGAEPGMWLAGADGTGREPAVEAMGQVLHQWDVGPVGIHYNPWQDDCAHWDDPWCAFHLCQTGHRGEHQPERVAVMQVRTPVRAVANGEPTYEGMGDGRLGQDAWQAEEAWSNLLTGGTFGAFYGAASLWQWKRDGDGDAWGGWCAGPWDWQGALELPGAARVGVFSRILAGLDLTDMTPDREIGRGVRAVSTPGGAAIIRLSTGEGCLNPWASSPAWEDRVLAKIFDETTGAVIHSQVLDRSEVGTGMGIPVTSPELGSCVVCLMPC